MLQMEKLQKVYRTEMVETYALRDFNLTVNEGEFVAVTGPSGSGKTTFLTIAGLLEAFDREATAIRSDILAEAAGARATASPSASGAFDLTACTPARHD